MGTKREEKRGSRRIRGIVYDGVIHPLDPLSADWTDGHEVVIHEPSPSRLELWFRELQRLGPAQYEPGEKEQMERIMKEADEEAKDWVRREMGLSEPGESVSKSEH